MKCKFKIEGVKVNLRTGIPSDLDDYDRWDDPDLEAWKFDGPWFHTKLSGESVRRKTRVFEEQTEPYTRLDIETKDGFHLGWVTVYRLNNDPHMTEVGIDIVEDVYWNRGMGTEALLLWVDYLFRVRDLTRIAFSTWDGNKRMIAVGQKLGFIEECRIRKGCEVGGIFYDRVKMGILREEWDSIRDSLYSRFAR